MNTDKKLYQLIILILFAGTISACGSASSEEKIDDNDDNTEITDCELGGSSIGNCSL